MGLFDSPTDAAIIGDAPRRYAGMHERGTRNLLVGIVALVIGYFVITKTMDSYLLRTIWPALTPDANGLTIVGTLDSRGDYDRNMFKVLHVNNDTRVELTDFGWRSIFTGSDGPLFEDTAGDAINHALSVDNETGYAMLEPYLRVGVAKMLGQPNAPAIISDKMPLDTKVPLRVDDPKLKEEVKTLGGLINYFGKDWQKDTKGSGEDKDGGGSASGREVEHGVTVPGTVLADTCPILLTSRMFTDAEVIEQPDTLLADKTYSVRLQLNREGRSRFYQWSRSHINESVVFVLNGEVVAAPRVAQTLDVNYWDVTNIRDEVAAKKLAEFVHSHAGK